MPLVTNQIMAALAKKYCAPAYAFLPQVADGTGGHKVRTADALAMSLWPSRGLHLHGFEVKQSRSDWLKELSQPSKAESIFQHCDFWWIAIGDINIVKEGELPPTWGLMAPKGNSIVVKIPAPALTPKPMPRSFLAALLRKASEWTAPKWVAPIEQIDRSAFDTAYANGEAAAVQRYEHAHKKLLEENAKLHKSIQDFQEASGVQIDHWQAGKIGEAVRLVVNDHSRETIIRRLVIRKENAEREAECHAETIKTLEEMREPITSVSAPPSEVNPSPTTP